MGRLDWADSVAATLGAGAMVVATQPLDTTKVNMQLVRNAQASSARPERNVNLFRQNFLAAKSLVASRGVRALWAGTGPALYAYCLEHAVLFTVYEAALRTLDDILQTPTLSNSALGKAVCCASSCSVSSFFLAPADAVKCKLQAAPHGMFRNSFDGFQTIVKHEGFTSLFKNYRSVLARDSTFFGTYILVKELILDALDGHGHVLPHHHEREGSSFMKLFIAGGFAGAAAWAVATPVDVLNSRRQAVLPQQVATSASGSLRKELFEVVRNEGLGTMFKGSGLNILRGFLGYGVFTGVYVNSLAWLQSLHG